MAKLSFSIMVDEAHLQQTQMIAETIGRQGMRIDGVVPEAGAIRAFGEESEIEALRRIDGVLEVTPERQYVLPPFDPEIPQ